jgi:hypothetical protein
MHIEDISRPDKLLAAVIATLARPDAKPSIVVRVSRKIQREFLSWVTIFGTAASLLAKLGGLLTLTTLLRSILSSWQAILTVFWKKVFFFLPQVDHADAVYFTIISFILLNVLFSLETGKTPATKRQIFSMLAASLTIATIFVAGFYAAFMNDVISAIFYCLINCADKPPRIPGIIESFANWLRSQTGSENHLIFVLTLIASVLTLSLAVPFLAKTVAGRHVNISILASRLWRVLVAIGVIVLINYFFVWLEHV